MTTEKLEGEEGLAALIASLTAPSGSTWKTAEYDPERDAILADNITVNQLAMDVKNWLSAYRQEGKDWHSLSTMQIRKALFEAKGAVEIAAYATMLFGRGER